MNSTNRDWGEVKKSRRLLLLRGYVATAVVRATCRYAWLRPSALTAGHLTLRPLMGRMLPTLTFQSLLTCFLWCAGVLGSGWRSCWIVTWVDVGSGTRTASPRCTSMTAVKINGMFARRRHRATQDRLTQEASQQDVAQLRHSGERNTCEVLCARPCVPTSNSCNGVAEGVWGGRRAPNAVAGVPDV